MRKLSISILIGVLAGIIDVTPMIIQGLDWSANLSAFVHWVVLGFVISYISLEIKAWLKGLIVALISSLPIIIIIIPQDPTSILPILIMSAILGSLVGFFSDKFAK